MDRAEQVTQTFLSLKVKPTDAQWLDFLTLPIEDQLKVASALASKISDDCDEWCNQIMEAHLATDSESQAETALLLGRLKL